MINKLIKYFIGIIFVIMLICIPLTCSGQNYKRDGNTFESTAVTKSKVEPIKTKFTYKDTDNIDYPIYISSTGSCFINKISKNTNKGYRKYLGPDISKDICKELNIEYKSKQNKPNSIANNNNFSIKNTNVKDS